MSDELESNPWRSFDYWDYCVTGPHLPNGTRYGGAVEVRCKDGSEKVAYFYPRLIGGFERAVGRVTHWRFLSNS